MEVQSLRTEEGKARLGCRKNRHYDKGGAFSTSGQCGGDGEIDCQGVIVSDTGRCCSGSRNIADGGAIRHFNHNSERSLQCMLLSSRVLMLEITMMKPQPILLLGTCLEKLPLPVLQAILNGRA